VAQVNREIRCSHVAITVPALEDAEAYYRTLFDMEVVTREAAEGRQLPRDKSWKDAHASGIDLYMVALRRGGFVLALFNEGPSIDNESGVPRTPVFVGLQMSPDDIAAVRARCNDGEAWVGDQFRDRYGIGWQLGTGEFRGRGDLDGRWLHL
jgi:catechol 2,3-dioxygenase-like lactoylglutathione lyase family enzyme